MGLERPVHVSCSHQREDHTRGADGSVYVEDGVDWESLGDGHAEEEEEHGPEPDGAAEDARADVLWG